VINVVVLQNPRDLLKCELGSSNETCETSVLDGNDVIDTEAEMVSDMTEEEEREPRTIPVIKKEPKVSDVAVVSITHILCRLYPELPAPISVCPFETKISL
jgi:hypothetical protein